MRNIMPEITGYALHTEISQDFRSILYRGIRESDKLPVLIRWYGAVHSTHGQIARFKEELSIIKEVKSVGLIGSGGFVHHRDGIASIMDDFNGRPLRECFPGNSPDMKEFLSVAAQLAAALSDIHHADITHSELKPGNIWIHQETGEAKIMDFGLSSILTRETEQIYDPYVLRETLPYFSPEQTGRMNHIMDCRTDFYSLGIIFYEILTGSAPFYSDNPLELFHRHIAKMPIPVTEVNPEIPKPVSDIVMKMISKDPEDRYQSGQGLKTDIEECMTQLKSTGKIEFFPLGLHDMCNKLIMPQKIYGREKELRILMRAFERASIGRAELILVGGFAGIGKTVLVNEVHRPIVKHKGYFISGKFDRLLKEMPYSGIVQAFTGLLRQILSENEERVAQWRRSLLDVLGNNGRILTDIIPELELLIGQQPEAEELGPEASENRFNLVFQDFLGTFAKEDHPLVIFLDDLQWADRASLNLVKTIVNDPTVKHALFIGAFRDNEVTGIHPLISWIAGMKKNDVLLHEITLPPIDIVDINELIRETLKCDSEASRDFAELVYRKTGGNPFFIKQFLKVLYNDKLLTHSPECGWQWNMDSIRLLQVEDDVFHLMARKILNLSEGTRQALEHASIIGNGFRVELLAEVYNKSIEETFSDLIESIQTGLITSTRTGWRFTHDRIQEAAYSLVPENMTKHLHRKIGKYLLQSEQEGGNLENVFAAADHLNCCVDLIVDGNERLELSRLNLSAGQKARGAVAYEAANRYLEMGIELLPVDAWEREYDLALSLYTEIGEVKYLTGDYENAEVFLNSVLKNAKRLMDKIRAYELKITGYTVLNKRKEALDLGIETLGMLGFDMPAKPEPRIIAEEMNAVKQNIGNKQIGELIHLPELTDPHKLAAARILMSCSAASYTSDPEYFPIIVLKLVNLSVQYGNSVYSAFAYVSFGVILCGRLEEIESGYKFGQLAMEIIDTFQADELKAKVYYTFGDMINHWKNHYRKDIDYLLEAYKFGSQTGDLSFASYALNHHMITSFLSGESLDELKKVLPTDYEVVKKYGQLSVIQEYSLWYQMVLNLNGDAEDKLLIRGDICDERKIVAEWERTNMLTAIGYYTVAKQLVLYLYGDFKRSIDVARAGERCIDTLTGMNLVAEYSFYYSLSLLAHYTNVSEEEQREYLSQVAINQKKIEDWASHAPENFEHKYLLIEAEKSSLNREMKSAIKLYDSAVESAGKNGFIQDEAIANERAGRFLLSEGMRKLASLYIKEAHTGYKKWGTRIKVSDLEDEFHEIFSGIRVEGPFVSEVARSSETRVPTASMIMDYESVVKSLQTLSSEIILEKLLEKLMKIVIESANATRGHFISVQDNRLFIEAERHIEDGNNSEMKSVSVHGRDNLLWDAVYDVRRTGKHIVLDDVPNEGIYVSHPYVQNNRIKSILCLPVVRRTRLTGILYLENEITKGAFTTDRIKVLKLLASQAAISLENAKLVDDMKRAEDSLRESELHHRTLFETAPTGIGICTPDGRIITYNRVLLQITGYSREELKHVHIRDIYMNPDDREWVLKGIRSDGMVQNFEAELKRKDGAPYHIRLSATPVTWNGEKAIMAVIEDVTKQKEAEALLEDSEEKYRLLAETAKDYIVVNSIDGRIDYTNKATLEALGYSEAEMLKMKITDLITPPSVPEYYDRRKRRKNGDIDVFVYEGEVITKSGKIIPVEVCSSMLTRQGKSPQILSITRNIVERKRTEKELLRYRNHLEELVRDRTSQLEAAQEELIRSERLATLGKLTATVSHEIRNPLGTIRSSLFLINQRTRGKGMGIEKALQRAERGILRCDRIIDDLMNYTRMRDLKTENTVVDEWLEEILDEQDIPNGIILKRNLSSSMEIPLDQESFRRCIVNLMDNAYQAISEKKETTPDDKTSESNVLTIGSRAVGRRLQVRIRDNGVGIPSDRLEKIFEPLYSTRGFGVGLGLSIVKQIMEQHGGDIEIESRQGEGTVVTLWVPMGRRSLSDDLG